MQEFTNTENEKKFIGVWKLDEWSVEKPNGNKTYPFAGDVSGYLIIKQPLMIRILKVEKVKIHN